MNRNPVSTSTRRCNDVVINLRRIMHAFDLRSKRLAREYGLTTPQIVVLQSIRELGETTTSALSAHISLSQATVTTILDRLEQRELVERYRSVVDRRVVHTRLTPSGLRVLKRVPALLHRQFVDAFSALRVTDQKNIVGVLQQVADMLGAAAAGSVVAGARVGQGSAVRSRLVKKIPLTGRAVSG